MSVLETCREGAAISLCPSLFLPSFLHQVRDAGEDEPFLLLSEDLKRELSAGQIYRRSLREFLWCSGQDHGWVGESWGDLRAQEAGGGYLGVTELKALFARKGKRRTKC